MEKWMRVAILFLFVQILSVKIVIKNARQKNVLPLNSSGSFLRNFVASENLPL
jgi:hypothetical protein